MHFEKKANQFTLAAHHSLCLTWQHCWKSDCDGGGGGGGTPCSELYGSSLPERHQFSAILVKFGLFRFEKRTGFNKLLGYY